MAGTSPPGPQHEHFTLWAKQQGVEINGVAPAKICGRGLGIVAKAKIEAGEELVHVPASALLTINSVANDFKRSHRDITVHGLLASFLAFGGTETAKYDPWKATWPSMKDFEESMPILWPSNSRESLGYDTWATSSSNHARDFLLPPAIGGHWHHNPDLREPNAKAGLLAKQETSLKADWKIVSQIFPEKTLEEYTYYWLVVNTRSFYFELRGTVELPHQDRMVLCPFVDYFNHNDYGCDVTFDDNGYSVFSDRAYEEGEELQTSYGSHSNDFLLCQYGFILENNRFDYLQLDDFFYDKQIDDRMRKSLDHAGYLGNYTLDGRGVCFRTQVAIRRQTMSTANWKKFMAGTFDDNEESRGKACIELHDRVLSKYESEADDALEHLRDIGDTVPACVINMVSRRWWQIRNLVRQAMEIHETQST